MTPKEKANEIVHEYLINTPVPFHIDDAKICASIAVNQILEAIKFLHYGIEYLNQVEYWMEVLEEIEKL